MWFFAQTVVVKAVGLLAQVALAYILVPEDFGLIGLALTITAFADVLRQNGLTQIVVQRHLDLERRGRTIFWLSLLIGLLAMFTLFGVAPLAALLFGRPEVTGLIWVLALAVPIDAAGAVPRAHLAETLQFDHIARITGTQFVLQSALTVTFALLGMGAMSFAIPIPVVAAITLLWFSRYQPLSAEWPPVAEQWRGLTRDTGTLVMTAWLGKVVDFGDYFLLGLFTSATTVGLYFFAFRLSIQSADIVVNNVGRVIFPTLAKLDAGSRRQLDAFTRASKALAGVGVPLAAFLVFFGPYVIEGVFDPKWQGAAIFVQILSVAAVLRTVADGHTHLLKAQGRYRDLLRWGFVSTGAFLGAVTIGGLTGGAIGVALAVAAHSLGNGWTRYYLSVRPMGGRFWDLGRVLAGPVFASLVSGGLALGLTSATLGGGPSWVTLLAGGGLYAILYFPVLRLFDRRTYKVLQEVRRRVTRALMNRAGKTTSGEER